MAFATPCFIRIKDAEKRKKVVNKLEELGYKNYGNPFQSTEATHIYTTTDGYYLPYEVTNIDSSWYDCGENEALFLALAALRDDSDYMQWFIYDKNFIGYKGIYTKDDIVVRGGA